MRTAALVIGLLGLLAATVWGAYSAWVSVGPTDIPTGGYVALWLGIIFSIVVGCGLMALIFYSSRHGYDEPAQSDRPPGETPTR